VKRQNPFSNILSCSDSRVSPEFRFDEQRVDLFVARIAENYLTTDFVTTLEYAVAILHTPLIMSLGHENYGAVKAAINAIDKMNSFQVIFDPWQVRWRPRLDGEKYVE
jgi:carbonic anhydrase